MATRRTCLHPIPIQIPNSIQALSEQPGSKFIPARNLSTKISRRVCVEIGSWWTHQIGEVLTLCSLQSKHV